MATSSHSVFRKFPPNAASGAKPIECTKPSKPDRCFLTSPARFSRCSLFETSSSITGAVFGNLVAILWVMLIARPKEESTISAPSSWAIFATWKAIEESVSTPVTKILLPSSIPI